jgi:tetraacyldisaccharide 4'-kinase
VRAALEAWLARRWYGGVAPGPVLRLLERVYAGLSAWHRGRQKVQPPAPVTVIVVGNFTAGGTGKTPLVIALAEHLRRRGRQPGIASRGYGRRGQGPVRVTGNTPPEACGDEPRLMFERTGLPVEVDADRVAAVRRLGQAGCDVVLVDDGLQHRRLARDLEIEVVDGERRYGNGHLLPAGPLREPPRPTDLRVVNGGATRAREWPMRLELGDARALAGDATRPLAAFAGRRVGAVAGIGLPGRFFDSLVAGGLLVETRAFADHHPFAADDFAGLPRPLLMTEKDAVKCRALGLDDAWVVPVEAELPDAFYALFDRQLESRGHGRA